MASSIIVSHKKCEIYEGRKLHRRNTKKKPCFGEQLDIQVDSNPTQWGKLLI